jgi:hypothetical protein
MSEYYHLIIFNPILEPVNKNGAKTPLGMGGEVVMVSWLTDGVFV